MLIVREGKRDTKREKEREFFVGFKSIWEYKKNSSPLLELEEKVKVHCKSFLSITFETSEQIWHKQSLFLQDQILHKHIKVALQTMD